MSLLYIVVLVVIASALLAVAIFRGLLVKTKADYLVAGRSLSAFVLVLTLLTSWIGAGSLFAGAENAYKNGFAALCRPAAGWACCSSTLLRRARANSRSSRCPIFSRRATTRPRACSAPSRFYLLTWPSPVISSRAAAPCCTHEFRFPWLGRTRMCPMAGAPGLRQRNRRPRCSAGRAGGIAW